VVVVWDGFPVVLILVDKAPGTKRTWKLTSAPCSNPGVLFTHTSKIPKTPNM
jgi:hypothetical protein